MKWFPLPVAALGLLAFGLAAYGDTPDGRPTVRSVLRAPLRQASIRRSHETSGPTVVEPSFTTEASPARTTGSGVIGGARSGVNNDTNASFARTTNRHGEPTDAAPIYAEPSPTDFVGGCCEEPNSKCSGLWDNFCAEKNGCASCDQGCSSCKQNCCRGPKVYRQDLFTYLKNKRAAKQASCGCDDGSCTSCEQETCPKCGHAPCTCGGDASADKMTPAEAEMPLDSALPAETPSPSEAGAPMNDVPVPEAPGVEGEGQKIEGPGNERAAMRRMSAPRRGFAPIRFGAN